MGFKPITYGLGRIIGIEPTHTILYPAIRLSELICMKSVALFN